MTDQTLPDLLSIQAQAVVDRAKALGLTWTLRPGTVNAVGTAPTVVYDGDTEQVGVTSLIGDLIPSDRVMMLQVPPAGNFVLGRVSGFGGIVSTVKQITTARGQITSTGDVTLTTASQAVTPLLSITTTSTAEYIINASIDLDQTASGGNNVAAGALQVNGVGQSEQMFFGVTAAGQRATVAQSWHGSLNAGTNTFQLISAKSLNIGTFIVRAANTSFTYQVWQ